MSNATRATGITLGADGREMIDGVPRLLVLAKTRRILDAFSARRPELSTSELASLTGIPASTCIRLVRNLVYDGMLDRVGDRYRIGLAIVRWASLALAGRSLIDISTDTLTWLRDETGESAQLCVREGTFAVVVGIANSHHSVVRQLRIGEVNFLHAGSVGRVFLAFDSAAWDELQSAQLEVFTPQTPASREQLADAVQQTRRLGYAVSVEERNVGGAGVTAPIFDGSGRLAAAIGVTGPTSRMGPDEIAAHTKTVLKAAHRISQMLGHSPANAAATADAGSSSTLEQTIRD